SSCSSCPSWLILLPRLAEPKKSLTLYAMRAPAFGFLAFTSGSFEGAIIRDMRLANALHARGHKVVVYWMMDRNPDLVSSGITQRMLCRGTRYQFKKPCGVMDKLGAPFFAIPARTRREFMQRQDRKS